MWIADNWTDYEVLDAASGEKLERWGDYILVRPDPQVIWHTGKNDARWSYPNGHYHRSKKGGGSWEFFDLPKSWTISYNAGAGDLTFHLKPFAFKHTGLFPEQAVNWNWITEKIQNAGREVSVLNLFAYTGGATVAAAKAGARVTHVDASKAWSPGQKKTHSRPVSPMHRSAGLWTTALSLSSARSAEAITMTASVWTRPPTDAVRAAKSGK